MVLCGAFSQLITGSLVSHCKSIHNASYPLKSRLSFPAGCKEFDKLTKNHNEIIH